MEKSAHALVCLRMSPSASAPAEFPGHSGGRSCARISVHGVAISEGSFRPTSPSAHAYAKQLADKRSVTQDKIPVPSNVHVLREGSILTISGPLGTNRTDLANLDTRGESAIRLGGPEDRSIDICSVSKAFHGTITSLIENKLEVGPPPATPLCVTGPGFSLCKSG